MFLLIALCYCGVWLAFAMLLSIVFRSAATAALVALGVWLFFVLIWPMLCVRAGADDRPAGRSLRDARACRRPATIEMQQTLARFSPNQLFAEAVLAILSPSTRALGPIYLEQLQGAVMGTASAAPARAC